MANPLQDRRFIIIMLFFKCLNVTLENKDRHLPKARFNNYIRRTLFSTILVTSFKFVAGQSWLKVYYLQQQNSTTKNKI